MVSCTGPLARCGGEDGNDSAGDMIIVSVDGTGWTCTGPIGRWPLPSLAAPWSALHHPLRCKRVLCTTARSSMIPRAGQLWKMIFDWRGAASEVRLPDMLKYVSLSRANAYNRISMFTSLARIALLSRILTRLSVDS